MNLDQFYYSSRLPDSFGSAAGLKRQSKLSNVDHYLSKQDAYTLHRDVRRRFPRRKTIALGINDLWQIDIVDLSSLARSNDNYRYLLTCIDVLSKVARVALLRTKSAAEVTAAFRGFITDEKCALLQSDKGKEFVNSTFQQMLASNNIKHYTSENDDIKCAVIERWHRTLMAKLYRYFTYANTERYVDVIQDLVHSYNSTYHSSIKMAPFQVDEHNESEVRERLLAYPSKKKSRALFKVGETVRISGSKRLFAKGYRDKWSEEVFQVVKVYDTRPTTYGIADHNGETIKGKFYSQELQKVLKDVYRVEKVLKTRKRGGKTEYFVKWLGYSDKFNSWTDDIVHG
jgi:transposase InsO family protein